MPRCQKPFFAIACIFFSLQGYAQTSGSSVFRHIDQTDGLLHNEVFSITQDPDGFMWIGTRNGLQRYDGLKFINYQQELLSFNTTTLEVHQTRTDKNNLWFTTELEVGRFEFASNRLSRYEENYPPKFPLLKYEAYTDSNQRKWMVSNFTIYQFDSSKNKMALFMAAIADSNTTSNMSVDPIHQQTWVNTMTQLLLFDQKTRKVYSRDYNPMHHPLLALNAKELFVKTIVDNSGNIWLSSWTDYLYKYETVTGKIYPYSLSKILKARGIQPPNNGTLLVHTIYEDAQSNIWIGTQNAGLLRYNRETDDFDAVGTELDRYGIQYNYSILCIYQDREQNIWLGTDKGISIFNPYRSYFQSIRHDPNNKHSLSNSEIMGFIQTNTGDVMIATWGGGVSLYTRDLEFKKNIVFPGTYEANLTWCFINTDDGKVWIGCQHGYLHIYDPVTGKITTIHPPELQSSTIRCMKKDQQGNIWLGLHNGQVAKWDKASNQFLPFLGNQYAVARVPCFVYDILIDRHQNFWVTTEFGFKKFDPVHRTFSVTYLPDKNAAGSPPSRTFYGISEYDDSLLLIGTKNGGLTSFNKITHSFSRLLPDERFISGSVHAIQKDAYNNTWFTSDYTLYKIGSQKSVTTYNITPGLINSSLVTNNFYSLNNGRWLMATKAEAILFHPDSLARQSSTPAKVAITGFLINDKKIFIDSLIAGNNPVRLHYRDNFITIEFSILQFSNIIQRKYFYRLAGVDHDWVESGSKAFANYTNLAPGKYTFSVKADADAQVTSFSIYIVPPFWKTWWFVTVVAAVAAFIITLIIRRRIQSIRREADLKHKIAETEMQALRAQMNPHFIFNCINAIDNLIQTDQKDKATTYLARFAKLIRVVLDSSKNNVVPFHKEYDALQLFLQLEQFRCGDKFEYSLSADEELKEGDYKVPPLLVQPFIENAIHHGLMNKPGHDKKLLVKIRVENGRIKYLVADNGVGREKALEIKNLNKPDHISYGIQISKERIHLYNKCEDSNDVIITDLFTGEKPSGTQVELSVKVDP
ncbi:MAG TPA: two-component regulator propeller domain-containing protein [Chitinophagaceae bacterium]|jgi:ligand-binding sensor domain-containing protein|nr:two-component regulator propeller domain-containing protein [Chitinophagaceae bacterium]